jgi:hypothetical protein
MLASRRWRDWNPPAIFQKCPERELTKPTEPLSSPVSSVLSVPTLPVSKINAPSASIPPHDLEEIPPVEGPIDEGWGLWLLEQCAFRDRWWGGTGALYLSLARWCASHGRSVPASRAAFVTALQGEGFQSTSDGLVYGLVLKADLEAYEQFQTAPNPARTTQFPHGGPGGHCEPCGESAIPCRPAS